MKRLIVVFCVTLAACATPGRVEFPYMPALSQRPTVVHLPPMNVDASAQIGDSMIEAYNIIRLPGLTVSQPIRSIALYRQGLRMAIDVPPTVLRLAGTDGAGGEYFESPARVSLAYERDAKFANFELLRGGIHRSHDRVYSVYWFWDGWAKPIIANLDAQPTLADAVAELPPIEARFRRSLVYAGTSQATIGISYREFVNDMARPSFTQDLRYDGSKGAIIGFKGARFEILDANNTSIHYRVLNPLAQE